MLKAIINALADRVRPCKHEWIFQTAFMKEDYGEYYCDWIYRCTKCGESKIISSK